MRLIFGLVLVLGLGLAGFAVYMAKGYIGQHQAQLAEAEAAKKEIVPTLGVFTVNKPLRYGQRLTKDDIQQVRWPVNAIPEGAFTEIEQIFPKGDDVLRTIIRTIEKDEALLAVKVTKPGEDAGVSSRLSRGMRAFAIRTDVTSGVSGFLRPGDRVDIYWTGQGGNSRGVTKLIETTVRLIAIDQSIDEDRNSPSVARTVTVEATPRQVASLAQAQATGRLSLSLVGADDTEVSEAVEIDQRDLLGIVEERIVEAPKEQVCTVRTRRGADMVDIPIQCSN